MIHRIVRCCLPYIQPKIPHTFKYKTGYFTYEIEHTRYLYFGKMVLKICIVLKNMYSVHCTEYEIRNIHSTAKTIVETKSGKYETKSNEQ